MSYKILSLDGGGSWALIQARVLQDLYGNITGHELLRKFDMAIANSGGSLVLACLCNNMRLSEVINVFKTAKERKQVFSRLTFREKLKWNNIASLFTRALGPRYSAERKLKGIIEVLKKHDVAFQSGQRATPIVETFLNDIPAINGKPDLQLLVVGFDYFRERASFFRSNTRSKTDGFNNGRFFQVTLAHAIHSSSDAPVNYFDAPATIQMRSLDGSDQRTTWFWDGGVSGFNNPVLAGLIEAITNNPDKPLQDFCLLSIGTGTGSKVVLTDASTSTHPAVRAIVEKNKNNPLVVINTAASFIKDIKKMSTSILSDPPDSATFIAYSIVDPHLTNNAHVIRINPCLSPVKDADDVYQAPAAYQNSPEAFNALLEMDMDATEDDQVLLIDDMCDRFLANSNDALPNQFIRGDQDIKHLGFGTYQAAKAKWMEVCG